MGFPRKHVSWPCAEWAVCANNCRLFGELGFPTSPMSELCCAAAAFEWRDPSVLTLTQHTHGEVQKLSQPLFSSLEQEHQKVKLRWGQHIISYPK